MSTNKDANIVKIAVEMDDQIPQLKEFNQKLPLAGVIQEICNGWGLSDADQYALQFSEKNNTNYITEKNRNEIKNGSVLRLSFSPSKTAADILHVLHNGTAEEKTDFLEKLTDLSTDITFAQEFINKQGLSLAISLVSGGKMKGNMLAFLLKSFVELMDHGIVSWEILEGPFISTVASYVNNHPVQQDGKVIQASLSILENIIVNSTGKYAQVEKEVAFPILEVHLQTQNPVIQQNTLALINAFLAKADSTKRKALAVKLCSKQVRNAILTYIIQPSGHVGAEMAHQLYVYQTYLLGLLEPRMRTKMDTQDQDAHEKIKELRKIAFDTEGTIGTDSVARRQLGVFAKDYKKLGFKYDINPALDFTETPPGMLALDCMVYFARTQTENYTKLKETRYYCKDCMKSYTHRNNLRRHVRSVHLCNKSTHKRPAIIFTCPQIPCDYTGEKDEMLSHYEDDHEIEIVYQNFTFSSMSTFNEWKNEIERKTIAQFVKVRQNRVNKGGTTKIDYICHRAGFSRITGKNIRKTKKVGSNKINAYCPAKIKVTVTPKGGVHVEFIKTHVGHTMDLVRINLNKTEREEIAKKLAENTPFDCILDDIRNSITNDKLERVHLLTRSDLYNIELSYNLSHDCARHKSVTDGVESWVEEVQSKEAVIRFFKPQGKILPNCPDLDENDFVLVVMNDVQLDMLEKFGGDLICIDGTHSMSSVDFQLFTLLVFNDSKQCFPCSFLLTSRSDETALFVFFTVLRESLSSLKPIKPNVFMSDVEDAIYHAWNCAMLPPTTRLYCSWNVDRAWRLNLHKINSKSKQAEVYKKVRTLLDEKDRINFSIMLNQVYQEMIEDPDTVNFAEYFKKFKENPQPWASCYRHDTGLDSLIYLERMHKTLKYIYNCGKGVKRLDKVMHTMMRFVKNKLFDQFVVINEAGATSAQREVIKRHRAAAELSSGGAEVEQDGDSWLVICSKATNSSHKVTPAHPDCECNFRCDSCAVCIHAFVCSCPDSSIRWNMCRHIHLVCQALRSLPALLPTLQLTTPIQQLDITNQEVIVHTSSSCEHNLTQEIKDKWTESLGNHATQHIAIATSTIPQEIHMTESIDETPVQVVVTPDSVSQQLVVTTTSNPNHMLVTSVTTGTPQHLEMVSQSTSTPQMDLMTNVTEAYIMQELKDTVISDHDYNEMSSYKDKLKTEICTIIESAESLDELNLLEKLMSPISQTLSAYRTKHFCCHVSGPSLETKTNLHL